LTGNSVKRTLLLLTCLLPCLSAAPDPQRWSATAEGAAVKLKNAAKDLEATSAKIGAQGRLGWLPVLRSQAEEVQRRAEIFERLALSPQEAEGVDPPLPRPGETATDLPTEPTVPGSSASED